MKYEFDYQLRQFELCVKRKHQSLSYLRDNLTHIKADRLREDYGSLSFRKSMLTYAAIFRKNALEYHLYAKKHRACLVQMHENAYYDQSYAEVKVA